MLHLVLLGAATALGDPKIGTAGAAGSKHITLTSGPGVSVASDAGTYELGARFSEIEESAIKLSTAAAATEASFAKYKEAIEGSCPTGSMVTGHNADGTLICDIISDDEWQRKVTVPCKGSAVLQSIDKDGTPKCVDPTPDEKEFQRRLASGCPDGQVVREVLVNGTVLCDAVSPLRDGDRRSIYTVFGSQSCKEQGELVYTGWMAGPHYNHAGSGANYLCMAMDDGRYTNHKVAAARYGAEYTKEESSANQDGALLYQIEYRYYSSSAGLRYNAYFTNSNPNRRNYRTMSCAVCEAKSPTALQVSGRVECPATYNKAQNGFLMGAYRTHKMVGPACITEIPQSFRWDRSKDGYGQASTSGLGSGYIYAAETEAPPGGVGESYYDNFEVPCLQCTADTNKQATVFTRFGHRDCPDKTKLIYTGWTAGSPSDQSGHGAARLCMPSGAQYTGAENRNDDGGADVVRSRYRTEYQSDPILKAQRFREVACAVCEAPAAAVQVFPGAQTCPAGYDANYKGYLMSSKYDYYGSEFTCVDEALQNIKSETTNSFAGALPTDPTKPNPNSMRDVGNRRADNMHFVESESAPNSGITQGVSKYTNGIEVGCVSCRTADPVAKAAVFTQWGKNTCSGGAKTLAKGWMANGREGHRGGGYNYQCMKMVAETPKKTTAGYQGDSGRLARVEYKSDAVSGTLRTNYKKVEYADAACAICEADAETTLMVPGKVSCPTGYDSLYTGFIVGSRYNRQHKMEFVCMDKSFEAIPGSSKGNQGAAYTYLAETEMPSPISTYTKYSHNMEVPCVVCAVN